MKKIILLSGFLLSVLMVNAQEKEEIQTLFKKGRPVGFYLGWSNKVTAINQHTGTMTGGSLAMSFGRKLNVGVAGYGLLTPVASNHIAADGSAYYYDMGYGGFLFEPMIASTKVFHVTFPVLVGAGGVGYHSGTYQSFSNWGNNYNGDYQSGVFFVAEPAVHLEVNLFKWLRFHAGGGYRFTSSGYFSVPQVGELDGWSATAGLKIGLF